MVHEIELDNRPRKLSGYMNAVVLPRRDYQGHDQLPQIRVTRRNATIDERHVAWFRKACGVEPSSFLPFIYPLAVGFHYHLAVFGHNAFPWSLRKMLALRNHVTQHRRLRIGELLDIDVSTQGLRPRRGGVEIHVHSVVSSGGQPAWESTHVYYLRGANSPGRNRTTASSDFGESSGTELGATWQAPSDGGFAFARLSGDYNPVHYVSPWARALGFRRAFCHTQRIISECMQRLPGSHEWLESEALQLDVAFKGPVYYGSELTLRSARLESGQRFELYSRDDERPAFTGQVRY